MPRICLMSAQKLNSIYGLWLQIWHNCVLIYLCVWGIFKINLATIITIAQEQGIPVFLRPIWNFFALPVSCMQIF